MNTRPTPGRPQAGQLQKLHEQLLAEIEVLNEKEANLREYEARLRVLVGQRPKATCAPFQGASAGGAAADLDAAWEKFHRSQALLEAERRAFADERLCLREQSAALAKREEETTRREAWIEVCEKEIAALAATTRPIASAQTAGRRSLPGAPFLTMKQLFGRAI